MHLPLTPIRCMYRAVDLYGHKTGVVSGSERFTYSHFGERSERLAGGLLRQGVRPGDRVAYLSFNTHQLLEGYFGVPLIRAVVLPLNVRLQAVELIAILNHAEPRVLLFENDFAPCMDTLRSLCPSVQRFISIDGPNLHADLTLDELLSQERLGRPDLTAFDENEPAELFYTSGSTAMPKGVVLSHRTIFLHALSVGLSGHCGDKTVELHTIPLFHANAWGRAHTSTLLGAKQVMVRRFAPEHVLRLIQEEGATSMAVVPTMANALLSCPGLAQFNLSSMQEIHIGGAASSPELIARMEQAFHCPIIAGYGLTETAPVAATARPKDTDCFASEEERLRHRSMAGWPVPGCEIRVVDSHMQDVARDMRAVGEIVVRGDNVMDGYYKDPASTDAAITDGWLHTGDMAVWDVENYVHIVDRQKDIIISGGENISSLEVEKAICAHPAVLECIVIAGPDEKWGEIPVAIVVVKPEQSLLQEELVQFLEGRLAKFKIPRIFEFSDSALPKTGTGKILKRELREKLWAGKERRVQG